MFVGVGQLTAATVLLTVSVPLVLLTV